MAPTITQLHENLKDNFRDFDNILYGRYDNNYAEPSQLYDTPRGYWRVADGKVPENHSVRLVNAIRSTAKIGRNQLDLVTMNEPTGEMWNAFVGAIVDLAEDGYSPTVRIMLGRQIKGGNLDIDAMLGHIGAALRGKPGKPLINMAQFRWETKPGVEPFTASWNHAKIIAADGRALLTGGHNLWSDHYLGVNDPIFDISIPFYGPIARGGHVFANGLWTYVNKNSDHGTFTYQSRLTRELKIERNVPADMFTEFPDDEKAGSSPALWVSNPGLEMFGTKRSSALSAFSFAMSRSTTCRLSLQDLGGIAISGRNFEIRSFSGALPFEVICHSGHDFNLELVDVLARFLQRGGTLDLVLTSPESGGWNYSNHVPISAVFNVISKRLNFWFGMSKVETVRVISNRMYLHNIAFPGWRKWPSGSPRHNHAKFWMFDDDLFYVGSENLYPSTMDLDGRQRGGSLQEFGVFLQDKTVAKALLDTYFEPMRRAGWRTDIDITTLNW